MTLISVACNNPDNGLFVGRFDHVHYGDDQDMEIACRFWGSRAGMRMRFLEDGRVRLGRRVFEYQRHKEWYGNWCWDAFWMERAEARRFLRYLREDGRWHCEGGPTRLYYWFNKPVSPENGDVTQ